MRLLLTGLLSLCLTTAAASNKSQLDWHALDQASMQRAQQQQRIVYLYVEAVWCHWCHVMQQTTLQDQRVVDLMQQHFWPIRVDHDARPDVADRYRDWGWPAHVFMTAQGEELVLRSGYIEPAAFARLLQAIVDDPSAEPASRRIETAGGRGDAILSDAVRTELKRRHVQAYDQERGGLRGAQKYLDRPHVEWAMRQALNGDKSAAQRAQQTLDAAQALLDPAWGGVYQYSTGGVWQRPHYEKLLRVQAAYMRMYALAARQWPQRGYTRVAQEIHRYVTQHLSAEDGSKFNSQDADLEPGKKAHDFFALDADQRKLRGEPAVDRSRYVLGNALWIRALVELYATTAEPVYLEEAQSLGLWLLQFQHAGLLTRGADAPQGLYLADNLASIAALLGLYRISADDVWLQAAQQVAGASIRHFQAQPAGFVPSQTQLLPSQPLLEDNIRAARVFNLLARYTGNLDYQSAAGHAMRYLSQESVALKRIEESGILLADDELGRAPQHLAVVAVEGDRGEDLHRRALAAPDTYTQLDWWMPGQAQRGEIKYPTLQQAAAYVCSDNRCSLPSVNPQQYGLRIHKLLYPTAVD